MLTDILDSPALVRPASVATPTTVGPASFLVAKPSVCAIVPATASPNSSYYQVSQPDSPQSGGSSGGPVKASACPCCHKSFFDRSTMKRHMKRHFADRETYDCIACSKSFTRKDKLRDHLKSARHILTVYVSSKRSSISVRIPFPFLAYRLFPYFL